MRFGGFCGSCHFAFASSASTMAAHDPDAKRPLLSVKVSIDRPSAAQIVTYAQTSNAVQQDSSSALELFVGQLLSGVASTAFLVLVVSWATFRTILVTLPRALRPKELRKTYEWDRHELFADEVATADVGYYAKAVGMHIEVDEVTTQDGFILKCVSAHRRIAPSLTVTCRRMHRVVNPRMQRDTKGRGASFVASRALVLIVAGGFPVLLMHGAWLHTASATNLMLPRHSC